MLFIIHSFYYLFFLSDISFIIICYILSMQSVFDLSLSRYCPRLLISLILVLVVMYYPLIHGYSIYLIQLLLIARVLFVFLLFSECYWIAVYCSWYVSFYQLSVVADYCSSWLLSWSCTYSFIIVLSYILLLFSFWLFSLALC